MQQHDFLRSTPPSVGRALCIVVLALLSATFALNGCSSLDNKKVSNTDEDFARMQRISQQIREITGPFQASGNLLGEVQSLRSFVDELAEDDDLARSIVHQMTGTVESFLGNHHEALRLFDHQGQAPKEKTIDPQILSELQQEDATDAVVRAAQFSRAVMINEAHHSAQHRVLTHQLLPLLRQQGFTHFAAETLNATDNDLMTRGYPTLDSGYYSTEPLYGDLIREAIRLGYQVVAYESDPGPPATREPSQARNLVERIFKDPDARGLIHVGFSHNSESAKSFNGVGSMAWHLEKLTGIDPLTVDQTRMSERSVPTLEDPLYRHVVDTLGIEEPTVFVSGKNSFWHPDDDFRDMTVFLPRTRYESGRPDWLRLGGQRQRLVFPKNVCKETIPCVIEVRYTLEHDDAIPIDRIEVTEGSEQPVLLVPKDSLRIKVIGQDQKTVATWSYP